ncbi:hypothetical protein GOODEAATRI_028880, partial [Goodea atripinnis]
CSFPSWATRRRRRSKLRWISTGSISPSPTSCSSSRCRDVGLRRLLLHVGAHDQHGEPVQQRPDPGFHQLGQHILVGFVLPGLVFNGLVFLVCYCIIISSLSRGAKGQVLKKTKALKKAVILVICFFGCLLPYCLGIFMDILTMLNVVSSSCEVQRAVEMWISVTKALACFHCCLNPILYAFLAVKFNQTARSTLAIIISSSGSGGWSQKATPPEQQTCGLYILSGETKQNK